MSYNNVVGNIETSREGDYKMRKTTFENRREALKTDTVFSFEQIEDVLDLIADKKWPDGNYGDNECLLWSLIRNKLGIEYW